MSTARADSPIVILYYQKRSDLVITYRNTVMAMTYNKYQHDYLSALVRKELNTTPVGRQGLLAINLNGNDLPRAFIPQVVYQDDNANTLDKTIVMLDGSKINAREVDLRHTLGVLTAAWETKETTFDQMRKFLTKAYCQWVGGRIASRFGLPHEDANLINIYLALYFYCAHSTPAEVLSKPAAFAAISEVTVYGAQHVEKVIESYKLREFDSTLSLAETIGMMHDISPEVRSKLSLDSVIATLSRSWVGETGVFYSNLAVEYPPAFATLLYYAIVDRGYRKTILSTLTEQYSTGRNKDKGIAFTQSLNSTITLLIK